MEPSAENPTSLLTLLRNHGLEVEPELESLVLRARKVHDQRREGGHTGVAGHVTRTSMMAALLLDDPELARQLIEKLGLKPGSWE